ncbi:MAG TPA: pirin family protein [Vicinamibacterales bacterium]|nr:pirin family protein [Vicinamibacterales bacterium]
MADQVAAEPCVSLGESGGPIAAFPGRDLKIGDLSITRVLPVRDKRLVGPWCFLDRFGPLAFTESKPLDVAPHPHIGLQTVTWLLEGEIVHDDSLGTQSVAQPGGVNVMTAGSGIAHAEQTPRQNSGHLSGVQLWVALPDATRNGAADFQHIREVPTSDLHGGLVQLFAGSLGGLTSPAIHHSPIVGAELRVHKGERLTFEVPRTFEHAALLLEGDAESETAAFAPHVLYYFAAGRTEVSIGSRSGARVLFIGGPPLGETILMWWNFVARTPEEIARARSDWEAGLRFGPVRGYDGASMPAPPLARFARPDPVS